MPRIAYIYNQRQKVLLVALCFFPYGRLMDTYIGYIDNYFFSFFSTRESLASNTSSIVESNRRQNPALSPAHGGVGPVFSFRATADPPTSETEKLQKPANCLQASVTSV